MTISSNNRHIVWAEKYRPMTVEECILTDDIKTVAKGFVASGKIPNLLFHGSAGTGKTTLARALCNELNYEVKVINGSNEGRLIDTLRTTVVDFASKVSFEGKRKCLIIDEADYLPELVQAALRNFIDEYSRNCSFVLTCNFPNRLLEPIHSRLSSVDFSLSSSQRLEMSKLIFKRSCEILALEGITYDKAAVAGLVKQTFPDTRKLLNRLQKHSAGGTVDLGALVQTSSLEELIGFLKGKEWTNMRSWVAKQGNIDFTDFCHRLYKDLESHVVPSSLPTFVMTTSEYQYRHHFVGDKEINTVAYLTQLMSELEFK